MSILILNLSLLVSWRKSTDHELTTGPNTSQMSATGAESDLKHG